HRRRSRSSRSACRPGPPPVGRVQAAHRPLAETAHAHRAVRSGAVRRGRGGAGAAPRPHRAGPGPGPARPARAAGPGRGAAVSATDGENRFDEAGLDMDNLTEQDLLLLAELDVLFDKVDPVPADLVERVQFAIALEDLDVEVARWERAEEL